jgi:predicted permease
MLPFRRLLAAPLFTLFAVLTLTLGIGATTAIYAVAEAALFRPLDIRDVDRVANVYHHDPSRVTAGHQMALSWPDAQDIARQQTVFSDVLLWSRFNAPIVGDGSFTPLIGELVSGNYFSFAGVQPLLGRVLQPADDAAGGPCVVAISEALWRRAFGGNPGIAGEIITLGHETCLVVGVVPATFRGVDMPNVMPTAAWMPLALADRLGSLRDAAGWQDRESRWVLMKGRLAPGRTFDEARTEILAIGAQLDAALPIGSADRRARGAPDSVRRFAVTAASDMHAHESVDRLAVPTAQAVLIAVALVLLVACTNLANLLLARSTRRRHEVAVRRALGATRVQVMTTLAVDSLVVAALGGAGGLLVAAWLATLLSGRIAIGNGLAITIDPALTPGVLAVALGATTASTIVFGLIPAWHTSRAGLRHLLDAQTGGSIARWRGRRWLIAAQVLVSTALLVPGALLLQQAIAKATRDPGFDLERLAAAQINYQLLDRLAPEDAEQPASVETRQRARMEQLSAVVRKLRATPGVAGATLVSRLPVYLGASALVRIGDAPPEPIDPEAPLPASALRRVASMTTGDAALFDTLGIRILAGAPFDEADVAARAPVAVVSQTTARVVFGAEAAVGRTLFVGDEPVTVVGVAGDTDWPSVGSRRYGAVYRPGGPDARSTPVVAVRAAGDPTDMLRALRDALREADAELPVVEAVTGPEILARQTLFDRIGAQIVSLLGGFALALALTGLAGLLSYVVASRRREIGVRMALGADRRRILRLVIADGLRPVLAGGLLGLAAGAGLSYLVGAYYYRLPGIDWVGVMVVAALVAPAAAVACYLPARRAAESDPNTTLREL